MSQSHLLVVAEAKAWPKFWDDALDYGPKGTKSALAILQTLCKTCFSDNCCSVNNCLIKIPEGTTPCDHFIQYHTDLNYSGKKIANNIIAQDFEAIYDIGLSLQKFLTPTISDNLT